MPKASPISRSVQPSTQRTSIFRFLGARPFTSDPIALNSLRASSMATGSDAISNMGSTSTIPLYQTPPPCYTHPMTFSSMIQDRERIEKKVREAAEVEAYKMETYRIHGELMAKARRRAWLKEPPCESFS